MSGSSWFSIHRARFANGLRALVVPMAGTSAVTLFIAVRTGSRNETPEIAGISHFLEHLFFKGSKKRPSTRAISEAIDRVGGEMNAFTSKEWTAFYAKAAHQHAELLVDVIGDMVLRPLLVPEEIDRERGVIIEEINMYEDTPMKSIGEFFEETLFGRHALAHPIIGTKENISRLPRETIARYLRSQYRAKSMVVCLAGNIDVVDAEHLLRRAFQRVPAGSAKPPSAFRRAFSSERVRVREKQTDQTHVVIGSPAVHFLHPDRFALDVVSALLGGGMSSRLFLEVRERRGLAYAVRTTPECFVDTGYVATQAGVDTSKAQEACRVIVQEHARVASHNVRAGELTKTKEFLKGRLELSLEGSQEVAHFVTLQEVLLNRIMMPEEIIKRVEAVRMVDVRRVAQAYLRPEHLRLVMIGPQVSAGKLTEALRV